MKTSRILNISRLLLVAVSLLAAGRLQAAAFTLTKGDLYVYQIGDGNTVLTAEGAAVFIDQFRTNGNLLSQVTVPTNTANAFIASGSSGTEGSLSLDPAGDTLVFMGYNTNLDPNFTPGISMNSRPTAGNNRDVGTVSASGVFAIASVSTNFFAPSTGAGRGAVTDDNGNYWAEGAGSTDYGLGVYYYGNNAAPAQLAGASIIPSPRSIQMYGTNLFFTGGGPPTTPGLMYSLPVTNALNGPITPSTVFTDYDGSTMGTPEGFIFNTNLTTCYIAEGAAGSGGIRRFDLVSTNWTWSYTFNAGTAYAFVTADFSGANPVIYATTLPVNGDTNGGNLLVEFVDSGAASTNSNATTLATAPFAINYNGIVFDSIALPQPSVPLQLTSPKMLGGAFNFSLTNTPSLSFQIYAATNLALPSSWSFLGDMTESPAGHYQYTDTQATNSTKRFYQVRWQ
jgi:hypothetical protein